MDFQSIENGIKSFIEGLPVFVKKQIASLNKLINPLPNPEVEKTLIKADKEEEAIIKKYNLHEDTTARFVRDVLNNIVINIPAVAFGAVTRSPNVALGTMALINILDAYPEYRKRYNEDFIKTWGNTLLDTAIETLTEKIPMDNLIALARTPDWAKFIKYLGSEIVQEDVTELLHIAHEKLQGYHASLDEVLERLAYTSLLTATSAPVLGGIGYTVGRIANKNTDPVSTDAKFTEPVYVNKDTQAKNLYWRITTRENGLFVNAQLFYDYLKSAGEDKVLSDWDKVHIMKLLNPARIETEGEKLLYDELRQELEEDLEKLYKEGQIYKKWYEKANQYVEEKAEQFKYLDKKRLAGIMALTSGKTSIEGNISKLEKYAQEIEKYIEKTGGDINAGIDLWEKDNIEKTSDKKGKNFIRKIANVVRDPNNIYDYGLKVVDFYDNIMGYREDPTIDRWMFRIFGLDPDENKQSIGSGVYKEIQKFIEDKAREKGLTPKEYQAILWMGAKKLWQDGLDLPASEYSVTHLKKGLGFKINTTLEKQELNTEIQKVIDELGLSDEINTTFITKAPDGSYYVFIKPKSKKVSEVKKIIEKLTYELSEKFNIVGVSSFIYDFKDKEIGWKSLHERFKTTASIFFVYNHENKPVDLQAISNELKRYDLRIVPTGVNNFLISTNKKNVDVNVIRTILDKYLGDGYNLYQWKQITDGNFLRFDYDPEIGKWNEDYLEAVRDFLASDDTIVFRPAEAPEIAKYVDPKPIQILDGKPPIAENYMDLLYYMPRRFARAVLPNNYTYTDLVVASLVADQIVIPKDHELPKNYKDYVVEETDDYIVLSTPEVTDPDKAYAMLYYHMSPFDFDNYIETLDVDDYDGIENLVKKYEEIAEKFGFASVSMPVPVIFQERIYAWKPEYLNNALEKFAKNLGIPENSLGLGGSINLILTNLHPILSGEGKFGSQGVVGFVNDIENWQPDKPFLSQAILIRTSRGSFAHEWFHAFDSYFLNPTLERKYNTKTGTLSEILHNKLEVETTEEPTLKKLVKGIINKDIVEIYKELLKEVYKRGVKIRIKRTSNNSKEFEYYTRHTEMLARAFEYWYVNKFGDEPFLTDATTMVIRPDIYPWDFERLDELFTKLFKVLNKQEVLARPGIAIIEDAEGVPLITEITDSQRLVTYFYKPKEERINDNLTDIEKALKEIDEFQNKFGVRVKIETNSQKTADLAKYAKAFVWFEKKVAPLKYFAPVITFTNNPYYYGLTNEFEIKISDGAPFAHELLHFILNKLSVYHKIDTEMLQKFSNSEYFKNRENLIGKYTAEEILAYAFENWFVDKFGEHELIANKEEIPEQFKASKKELKELHEIFDKWFRDVINFFETEYNKSKGLLSYITNTTEPVKSNVFDKIYALWIRSILSAPSTHLVNIVSNIANYQAFALTRALETMDLKTLYELEKLFFTNIFTGAKSIQDTFNMFLTLNEPQKIESSHIIKFGGLLDLPVKALEWEDAFFKSLVYNGYLVSEFYKYYENKINPYDPETENVLYQTWENLKDLEDRRFLFLKHPPAKAQEEAIKLAREFTFTDTNELIEKIIEVRDKIPGLRYLIPFIRTPSNILKSAIEYSPAGLVIGVIQNNPHLTAKSIAGLLLTGMIGLALTNCEDDENLYCEYLKKIEPFSELARIIEDPKAFEDLLFFENTIRNLYYLFVKNDIIKPIESIIAGFVPNVIYRISLATDPYMRAKEKPVMDAIINKTPFRKILKAYYNEIGEPVAVRNYSPLTVIFSPRIKYELVGDKELEKLYKELGIKVYPHKVKTPYEVLILRAFGGDLKKLARDPDFKNKTIEEKKMIILSIIKNRNRRLKWIQKNFSGY